MAGARTLWKTFALQAALMGVVVFVAVRAAVAREGVSGGPTRTYLTVAGTLAGVDRTRATAAQFTFENARGFSCGPIAVSIPVVVGSSESFSVEVPIDECRSDLFDGANVTARVQVAGLNVATTVNPVPYARYSEQYGTPDCPVGYRLANETGFPAEGRLCQRLTATDLIADVVVRVGDGPSAFWVDRYEASVWSDRDGTRATTLADGRVVPWGEGTRLDDYPPSFPKNGQWTVALYALSRAGVAPSTHLTWFQAAAACRASGKRLPTGEEWLAGARGTRDPGTSDGADGTCITSGSPRVSGGRNACTSAWGAQDMIGNFWEWTAEWYASQLMTVTGEPSSFWGADLGATYGTDGTWNITSATFPNNGGTRVLGLPAAAFRGGSAGNADRSGIFAVNLGSAPSMWGGVVGFRCVISR